MATEKGRAGRALKGHGFSRAATAYKKYGALAPEGFHHMSEIKESFTDFTAAHPGLKFIFFGGKGGVGKTVMAGVAALHLAQTGKRTILASTNPVHSLSGLLDQNVYGAPTAVKGAKNL